MYNLCVMHIDIQQHIIIIHYNYRFIFAHYYIHVILPYCQIVNCTSTEIRSYIYVQSVYDAIVHYCVYVLLSGNHAVVPPSA